MTRTFRSALETRLGQRLPLDHLVTPWIIRHAAANITRHQVRSDGKTAFSKMKGYDGIMPVNEFGEVVHFKQRTDIADPQAVGKYEDRYRDGVFVGYDLRSGEHLVATETGVYRTGACKRKAEDQQWSLQMINNIVGDPEHPIPGGDSGRPPTYTKADSKKVAEAAFVPQSELPPIQVGTLPSEEETC